MTDDPKIAKMKDLIKDTADSILIKAFALCRGDYKDYRVKNALITLMEAESSLDGCMQNILKEILGDDYKEGEGS